MLGPEVIHLGTYLCHLPSSDVKWAGSTAVACLIKNIPRTSLVAQWLRICLLMQGTRVRALVWEDPTCRGVTGPREPRLLSLRVWSLCSPAQRPR